MLTVRTEGGLLPADILARIAAEDSNLGGFAPSAYQCDPGERTREAISRAWPHLQAYWRAFQQSRATLPPSDAGTTLTRERWMLPLFRILGYGPLDAMTSPVLDGRTFPVSHHFRQVPVHLVSFRVALDTRTPGVAGAARSSPHSLVQEFLNRSDDHLWGIVANGLRLRILRDNSSLTRQAFVEFDLEAMMEDEVYPDFALLWLLLHQSRVDAEKPEDTWLEKWSQAARTEGIRALDRLWKGVRSAIESLGRGFLSHPANTLLRESLRSGMLDKREFYRQLLRLTYRLLFLLVAEERNGLHPPGTPLPTRERYRRFFSTRRLREISIRRPGNHALHRHRSGEPDSDAIRSAPSRTPEVDDGCTH